MSHNPNLAFTIKNTDWIERILYAENEAAVIILSPGGNTRNTPYTVDLVISAGLNFREFLILGLFTKFRISEFFFFFSSAIIIIIFARFLNSRICPPREN